MREKAFEELVKIGEPAVLALRNALKKWTVREGAAEALKAVNEKTKETKAKKMQLSNPLNEKKLMKLKPPRANKTKQIERKKSIKMK
ncbi:MAG: hypothetical protein QW171_03510 [Candidatus Bilamarchaeaceae archaeon]